MKSLAALVTAPTIPVMAAAKPNRHWIKPHFSGFQPMPAALSVAGQIIGQRSDGIHFCSSVRIDLVDLEMELREERIPLDILSMRNLTPTEAGRFSPLIATRMEAAADLFNSFLNCDCTLRTQCAQHYRPMPELSPEELAELEEELA
ncbi:MAG TPA: hypothetical protein VKQ11_00525 [Candidatus Sulfotelmatobacter sp.]|nr:hypothetical protein [Candidatus Sulfotelmatobacter sp.]